MIPDVVSKPGEIAVIGRWDYTLHSYIPYMPPVEWTIALYTTNMDLPINCTNCGAQMTFGDGFTSKELHNESGMGFPVCSKCHDEEFAREREARRSGTGEALDCAE